MVPQRQSLKILRWPSTAYLTQAAPCSYSRVWNTQIEDVLRSEILKFFEHKQEQTMNAILSGTCKQRSLSSNRQGRIYYRRRWSLLPYSILFQAC